MISKEEEENNKQNIEENVDSMRRNAMSKMKAKMISNENMKISRNGGSR
jgi:hypothetical protein